MEKVRFGIIGVGNMGSIHSKNFLEGKVENGVLTAICDLKPEKIEKVKALPGAENVATFSDYKEMLASGLIDVCVVAVPHYFHPQMTIDALNAGLNVICEKPAGVYTKQVKEMNEVAKKSDKLFAMMFNQRTNCIYRKMREMIQNGELGEIRRINWIITNWYRSQSYYDSGDWRATWRGEGGGVLFNQCPHQLDLLSWVTGMMPKRVHSFCHFGKWHDIEVEDDVTAYMEFPNGATGTFITTTADWPGTNRLEITGSRGTLIFDSTKLTLSMLAEDEREFCYSCKEKWGQNKVTTTKVPAYGENPQHAGIINNCADALHGLCPIYAPGTDGIHGVALANAMLLSGFEGKTVTMPVNGKKFKKQLDKRIKASLARKK